MGKIKNRIKAEFRALYDLGRLPEPVQIKCPYCGEMFFPREQRPTTTGGNIARGAVFLPWGVTSAVKNKPFVQCTYCRMKIPQG